MPTDTSASFQAHDLIWLRTGAAERMREWAVSLPDWALSEVERGTPLIVRRAPAEMGAIPVGIRGRLRSQRYATYIAASDVARMQAPVDLCACPARSARMALPCLSAWERLRLKSQDFPYPWGPTGSCAYELATGADWVTQTSDLDVVVHIDKPITPSQARELLDFFNSDECRIDVQVVTPLGGVALIEWARGAEQVLLKTNHGPVLTEHPWGIFQEYL